jgi:hypothetical protein
MLYRNGKLPKKKLSKIFIDQWKESLNSEANKQGNMGNKLRTYRKFKNLFKFEEYLQSFYVEIVTDFKTRNSERKDT